MPAERHLTLFLNFNVFAVVTIADEVKWRVIQLSFLEIITNS